MFSDCGVSCGVASQIGVVLLRTKELKTEPTARGSSNKTMRVRFSRKDLFFNIKKHNECEGRRE